MAELIRLDRPPADFAISVSGISPSLEITKLENYLRELAGGPLWSLIVHEEDGGGGRRKRRAMAFFYCESDLERCRTCANGLVLAGSQLSTQRLTKLRGSTHPAAAGREGHGGIPASKAIDLMNHFVGFNQWSSELLHLGLAPAAVGNGAAAAGGTAAGAVNNNNNGVADAFVAQMRVTVPAAGIEVTADATSGGMESKEWNAASSAWECRAQNKKAAVTGALKAALAKLCIIRFANGKTVVRAVEKPVAAPTTSAGTGSSLPVPVKERAGLFGGGSNSTTTPTSSSCYSRKRPAAAAAAPYGAGAAFAPSATRSEVELVHSKRHHVAAATVPELCD